jgi:cytochrome c oxidase subunit II
VRRFFISGLLVAGLVVLVGVGFLAWIGSRGGLTPVAPASDAARGIQAIYVFVGAFASAIFLVVTIPLVLFAIRFRQGERDRSVEGPQIRGHARLELTWTAIPVLILIGIATFTFFKLPGIRQPARAADGEADLVVRVEGRQFYWRFVYPNGAASFDTIRLPVDRRVRLEVTAPESDVIHSFWVPALGGKMDAIPGLTNTLWLRPTRTGSFPGKCAELCGIQHGAMLFTAEVMPQEEFDGWLSGATSREGLGQEIFEQVCSKCHFAAPEFAPNIAGNPILADPEALRALVENGRRRMPAVGKGWSEAELKALSEFAGGTGDGQG